MSNANKTNKTNKQFSKVDLEMYGVIDIEALAEHVDRQVEENKNALAVLLLDMLGEVTEDIELNPSQARQTINRARFLITRCCPLLHPEKDSHTEELDLRPVDHETCEACGFPLIACEHSAAAND